MNYFKVSVILGSAALLVGAVYYSLNEPTKAESVPPRVGESKIIRPLESDISRQVLSAKTTRDLHELTDLLDSLSRKPRSLTHQEAIGLISYIKEPKPEGIKREDWQFLMNGVFNAVRHTSNLGESTKIAETLAHLAQYSDDQVIRLYALQHIAFWFSKETQKKDLLVKVLMEESKKTRDTAGTAIMVMNDLLLKGDLVSEGKTSGVSETYVEDAVMLILLNKQATNDVRRAGVMVCVDRKLTVALPLLRKIAQNKNEQMHLRKSAIAAIRELGDRSDLPFIQQIHDQGGSRIKQATQPALEKLLKA